MVRAQRTTGHGAFVAAGARPWDIDVGGTDADGSRLAGRRSLRNFSSVHSLSSVMGKKSAKSARKFAASGQLKKKIQARHKHQQTKKKFEKRRGNKGQSQPPVEVPEPGEDEDEEVEETGNKCVLDCYT